MSYGRRSFCSIWLLFSNSFLDVYKLAGILHYNFGLECTVQNHSGKPVIYVTAKSMPLFISIVKPHFYPGFLYKLGLDK